MKCCKTLVFRAAQFVWLCLVVVLLMASQLPAVSALQLGPCVLAQPSWFHFCTEYEIGSFVRHWADIWAEQIILLFRTVSLIDVSSPVHSIFPSTCPLWTSHQTSPGWLCPDTESVWQATHSVHWDTCSPWELSGTFVLKYQPVHQKLVSRMCFCLLNARNTSSGNCACGYSDPFIRGLLLLLRDTVVTRVEHAGSQPAWDSTQACWLRAVVILDVPLTYIPGRKETAPS